MEYQATILATTFVTHDVKRFAVSRPDGFQYQPGQGVEITIDSTKWRDESRPFTPTSLTDDRILEFVIKRYPAHDGVTNKLHTLNPGDKLLLSEPFGSITYNGVGTFIAGGAGITPFIAITRQLAAEKKLANHRLIFSNKTPADVICEKEFQHYFAERCILTCTQESAPGYDDRRIDSTFLESVIDDFDQTFYVCGPPSFMDDVKQALEDLGAKTESLVFEK
jgi:ferredoxin-NADP reductase